MSSDTVVSMSTALLQTDLGGRRLVARGKVRDIYEAGAASTDGASASAEQASADHAGRRADDLLFIATDRISAFDHVLGSGIPDKGRILTQISLFWFDLLRDLVPNHVVTTEMKEFPESLQAYREQLAGRSMIVRRADMFPVECVVRGYISGSGWKDYQATGEVCGVAHWLRRGRTHGGGGGCGEAA
jgi:phosphoribosylaminoimidazole-succinocarboxamide synthase